MKIQSDKQENKSSLAAGETLKNKSGGEGVFTHDDNRPDAVAQRKIQEAISSSPRMQQLKDKQAMVNNSMQLKQNKNAVTDKVVQRVQFSNTNSFYPQQHDIAPGALPPEVKHDVARAYTGNTEAEWIMARLSPGSQEWLRAHSGVDPVGELIYAHVPPREWEALGAKDIPNIEIVPASEDFFDQQTGLMNELNGLFADFIGAHPGVPLRIASFRFARVDEGPLITDWAVKAIEPLVAPSITEAFLPDRPDLAGIRQRVKANVNQTLFSSGQFHWLAANWANISATHDVFVDVDYYPNRTPDSGGLLHKDSVGETLFVNLSYNNTEPGASPEFVADNEPFGPFEDDLPQSARDLIAHTRLANAGDDGNIKGLDLPARGRVSFIDPTIFHATPLYNHRVPPFNSPEGTIFTFEQIRGFLRENYEENNPDLYAAGLKVIEGRDGNITGAEAKMLFRNSELLRFGQRAGHGLVDKAPERRQRARSIDLTAHPERLAQLREQSQQARSFIRTWVILRRKPV